MIYYGIIPSKNPQTVRKRKVVRKTGSPELEISKILKKKKRTLVVAESCTGGLVSHRITNIPGSSVYFMGGIIAYSNDVKMSMLGVSPETIKKYGAVSREVVLAMAEGARRALNADIAVSVTGIAGPTGGTAKKSVGLAYIAFVSGKHKRSRKVCFKGNRVSIKEQFAQAVLEMIRKNL